MAELNLKAGNNITLTKNGNDLEIAGVNIPEVNNVESNSTTDTYSCDYINNNFNKANVNTSHSTSTEDTYSCDYVNNLIATENVSVNDISLSANSISYVTFTVPSKTGYTPIGITITNTNGAGSGYLDITPVLSGYLMIRATQNTTVNVSLKIIYLKN